jgi:acyl-CoA synthetase (AMP-forming)/AMP-acid ligase II
MGFRDAALQSPDKPAIVMVESGETVSYGELSGRADQYANYFRQLGFAAGDSVAFTLENCPEFYAGTEGSGFCAVASKEWLEHKGTVGRP